MNILYLVGGMFSFGLSFFVHRYYIQFVVLAIFLCIIYMINKNSQDISDLKKLIEDHNKLMREDINHLKENQN